MRDSKQYTISVEDIKKYLRSKEMNENVAKPRVGNACFIARSLVYKYGTGIDVSVSSSDVWLAPDDAEYESYEFEIPAEVLAITDRFDALAEAFGSIEFTRAQIESEFPELSEGAEGDM